MPTSSGKKAMMPRISQPMPPSGSKIFEVSTIVGGVKQGAGLGNNYQQTRHFAQKKQSMLLSQYYRHHAGAKG